MEGSCVWRPVPDGQWSNGLSATSYHRREGLNMPSKMDWIKMVSGLAIAVVVVACAAQFQQQERALQ
jgi:uncharacterized membrane protein YcfT